MWRILLAAMLCACAAHLEAASVLLRDINQDPNPAAHSDPLDFICCNGSAAFTAYTPATGREVVVTNGTTAGTVLVDMLQGPTSSEPRDFVMVGNLIFFTAIVGNPRDGFNQGRELCVTNCTAAGTFMVRDIWPGSTGSDPQQLTRVGGLCFFTANGNNGAGRELWRSDGTFAGTFMIRDINGTAASSNVEHITEVILPGPLPTCFFSADGGPAAMTGIELYRSNGVAGDAALVRDIFPGNFNSSRPMELTDIRGALFFSAVGDLTANRELWRSDGTLAGTFQVLNIAPAANVSSEPLQLTHVNGLCFFTANDGTHGRELWRSDGTPGGTFMPVDIFPVLNSSNPDKLLASKNGLCFFTANDNLAGRELWRSDGTTAGTFRIEDLLAGLNSSNPDNLVDVCGTVFFTAIGDHVGREVFHSNGVLNDATLTRDINPGNAHAVLTDSVYLLGVPARGQVVFAATNGVNGIEVWVSNGLPGDGMTSGTFMLDNLNVPDIPPPASSEPRYFTLCGSNIFFSAFRPVDGREPWLLPLGALPAPPTLSIDDVAQNEGDAGTTVFTFTVTLSEATPLRVCVDFASADGTATLADSDYLAAAGTLLFLPFVTTQPVQVSVNGDGTIEFDETFFVNLSNPCNAAIFDGSGQGTILDDDNVAPLLPSPASADPNPLVLEP